MAKTASYAVFKNRTDKKLKKFGLGQEGKRSVEEQRKATEPKKVWFINIPGQKKEEAKKEEDGKLMKTDDDKKEDLQNETVWATMNLAGGPLTWIMIVGSFFAQQSF